MQIFIKCFEIRSKTYNIENVLLRCQREPGHGKFIGEEQKKINRNRKRENSMRKKIG